MTEISYTIGLMQLALDYFHFNNKNLTKKQNEMIEHLDDALIMLKRVQDELREKGARENVL